MYDTVHYLIYKSLIREDYEFVKKPNNYQIKVCFKYTLHNVCFINICKIMLNL